MDKKLNIGCENDYKEGWLNIDFKKTEITKPDKIINLNSLPLPFQNNEFDLIQCTEVLEHVLYPESVLKELKRILKKKGKLIISMPNETNILERITFLIHGALDDFQKEMPHHFHFTNTKQQIELYSKYFKINKITYSSIKGNKYNKLPMFIRNFLLNKFPNLFSINMVCELTLEKLREQDEN